MRFYGSCLGLCALLSIGALGCDGAPDDITYVDPVIPTGTDVGLGGVVAEPSDPAAYVYDQAQLRTYELLIDEADLASLDANPRAEVYVKGTLLFEGQAYGPVGVRYKGSVGAFTAPCISSLTNPAKTGKCSIKVSFNEYEPDQKFFGLKKLLFHAMGKDPSMMRERLAYAMYRESGVPAPRSAHARLLINGRYEGLFALVEEIDGRFTRSRFKEGGKGNLYKEIWPLYTDPATYANALETNEDEPLVDAFVQFHDAVGRGHEALTSFVDLDATLTVLAVDRVMGIDDGPLHFYCVSLGKGNNTASYGNHNYYWYQGKNSTRFWLIPWDVDLSAGANVATRMAREWRQAADCSCSMTGQYPSSCDPLVREFIALSPGYERRVDTFVNGPFRAERVDELLAAWETQIRDFVLEGSGINGAPTFEQWQSALMTLKDTLTELRANRGYQYDAL